MKKTKKQQKKKVGSLVITEAELWYQIMKVYGSRAVMRFPSNVTFSGRKDFLWELGGTKELVRDTEFLGRCATKFSKTLRQWEDSDLR